MKRKEITGSKSQFQVTEEGEKANRELPFWNECGKQNQKS